jgi:hypothetical protein
MSGDTHLGVKVFKFIYYFPEICKNTEPLKNKKAPIND